MPRCEDYIEHISAAIDGELSSQQRAQLDAHLAQCPACRALLDDLTALHTGLGSLPLAAPPQELNEAIMAAVRGSNVTAFPAKKPFYWKKWLSSAAVLALIVAAGWSWRAGSIRGASSSAPMGAEPNRAAGQSMDAAVPEAAPANGEAPAAGSDTAGSQVRAAEPVPASATFEDNTAPAESDSYGGASDAPGQPASVQAKAAAAPSEAPAETALEPMEESGPVAPRMFSVQGVMAANRAAGETANEEAIETADGANSPDPSLNGVGDLGQSSDQPVTFVLTSAPPPEQEAPAVGESPAPATRTLEDGPAPLMAALPVTAEEAATALANYIYEFVGDVELRSTPEDDAVVYAVDSPTGVSGSITLTGEDESLFFLEYRDSEGGEALRYTVDKTDAAVTWLDEAPED